MGDGQGARQRRIVQLTDWLPPEFSAVSQYAILIAEEEARGSGAQVTVVGLSTTTRLPEFRRAGAGSVCIMPVRRVPFDRGSWVRRLLWTAATNMVLLYNAWSEMRRADEIRFTGSPPFLLHFLSALNILLRKRLVYRITDFYPECIIAALPHPSSAAELVLRATNILRRRVDEFEVIGNDMRRRLLACGVEPGRIKLRRDRSPVEIGPDTRPLERPAELKGRRVILYSGNLGVAHDVETFFEGYRLHHQNGRGTTLLWLNATGSGADDLDARLRDVGLPFYRGTLVALEELARLLITPDAHLITLRPEFEGFVLPSKVYGCIASQRPILFIGPSGSDVHELCSREAGAHYRRVDIGRFQSVAAALEKLGTTGNLIAAL